MQCGSLNRDWCEILHTRKPTDGRGPVLSHRR